VAGKAHLDLTWGRSVVWQDRINEMKALQPKHIYPGHGNPGGPEILDETMAYLKFFHEVVATRVKAGGPAKITPADLTAIKQQVVAKYPKYDREELLDRSIAGEYAVQLAALPPSGGAPDATAQGATPATPAATPAAPATPPAKAEAKSDSGKSGADELLGGDSGKDKKKKKKK
jgi:glyoxylase-like metal-dependent hydrolase (beta-lactamase superfamily II)